MIARMPTFRQFGNTVHDLSSTGKTQIVIATSVCCRYVSDTTATCVCGLQLFSAIGSQPVELGRWAVGH